MEGLTSQSIIQTHHILPCSLRSPSRIENEPSKNYAVGEKLEKRFRSLTTKGMIPRRLFSQFMGFNPLFLLLQPVFAAPMPEMKEFEVIRVQDLKASQWCQNPRYKIPQQKGYIKIIEGEGPEARDGNTVEINYVCRRSNGYFVHSTVDQFSGESSPVVLPLDDNQIIKGLKDVLIGMRVGGKRRALIPPTVGYVNKDLKPIPEEFGPRRSLLSHAKEPLIFEVQLLKLL